MAEGRDYWTTRQLSRRSILRGSAVGVAGLAGAALIGCGGSSDGPAAGGTTAAGGAATKAAEVTAKKGGTLTVLHGMPPLGFDPYQVLAWQYINYAAPTMSQLIRLDPAKSHPLTSADIKPDLAEKWEVGADGKSMTFNLRKGVKFHDGSTFTAKDAKWSIERMADPKTTYFAGEFANMSGVETPDDNTVKVNWKTPSAAKLASLASGYSVMLSEKFHSTKDKKKEEFAMGTGPFRLASFTSQKEYKYERNKDYFVPDRPYLDGLSFRVVAVDAVLPAMISGQGDVTGAALGAVAAPEEADMVTKQAPKTLKLWSDQRTPNPLGRAVYFNVKTDGPWKNPDVRKAMALVLDRQGMAEAQGAKEGWAQKQEHFLPGMAMDNKEAEALVGWDKPIEERVKQAKALLSTAGVPNGFKMKALLRNQAEYLDFSTLAQESWKKHLGIDVAMDLVEVAVETQRKARFEYDMLFFYSVFRSGIHPTELGSQFLSGSAENWARTENKELDAIFAKIDGTLGGPELTTLAKQAQTHMLKDMGAIPLYRGSYVRLTKPEVMGIASHIWLTNKDYVGTWLNR